MVSHGNTPLFLGVCFWLVALLPGHAAITRVETHSWVHNASGLLTDCIATVRMHSDASGSYRLELLSFSGIRRDTGEPSTVLFVMQLTPGGVNISQVSATGEGDIQVAFGQEQSCVGSQPEMWLRGGTTNNTQVLRVWPIEDCHWLVAWVYPSTGLELVIFVAGFTFAFMLYYMATRQ